MRSGRSRDGQHVLVVDDDDAIRRSLSGALGDEGHTVLSASDGQMALQGLREASVAPSIAIIDLMMPVMSGWDLIGVLRNTPQFATLPIIVVSAMRPRDLPPGVMFVAKPFDLDEICQLVANNAVT